jgi:peroxiredoxin
MTRNTKRNKRKSSPLPLILTGAGLIFIAIAAFVFFPKETPLHQEPIDLGFKPASVNYSAPPLELTEVDGTPASLADYRGKIVLVNNWATWCPPCKAEMPDLEAYHQAHKNDGFTIIGISAGDTQEQVADFIDAYGITFPMWLDPHESALAAFQTMNLPSSFVIDATGTVRLAWTGAISLENLERFVTPLLKE